MLDNSVMGNSIVSITTRPDYEGIDSHKLEKLQRWLIIFYLEQGYNNEEVVTRTTALMEQILEEAQVNKFTIDRQVGHYLKSHNELNELILSLE